MTSTTGGLPARPPAARAAPGDRQPGRSPASRSPACALVASWWRSARPTCDSRPTRRRRTSTTGWDSSSPSTMSLPWRGGPRGGSPRCSSRRSRCRVATTSPGSSTGFAGDDRYVVDYLVEEVVQRLSDPRPEVPAADLDPGAAQRTVVRRRHRPGRRQGDAGGAGPAQPLPGPARRPSPLVPLPPPLRRRAACAPARRAARPGAGPPSAGQRLVRAERRTGRRRSITRSPPGTSSARRTWWSSRRRPRQRERREATLRGWLERLPDDLFPDRPVLSVIYVGALMATGTTEGVEPLLRDAERWVAEQRGRPGMPARDAEGYAASPAGSPSTAPAWHWPRAIPTPPMTYGQRALELLDDDDDLGHAAATTLIGPRVLGTRGPRGRARRPTPTAWCGCAARDTSPTSSAARSRWPTSR